MMPASTIGPQVLLLANNKVSIPRPARRIGRSGQGIIKANRKTEICQHWIAGACPFGEKCAFAHGEHELRILPCEGERNRRCATGSRTNQLHGTPAVESMTTCSNSRSTVHNNHDLRSVETEHFLRGKYAEARHHSFGNSEELDRFWLASEPRRTNNNPSPPVARFGLDSQRQGEDNQAGTRYTFSLWQSPNTALQGPIPRIGDRWENATNAADGAACSAFYKVGSRINTLNNATPPAATTAESVLRTTPRENETWNNIVQRGFGESGSKSSCRQIHECWPSNGMCDHSAKKAPPADAVKLECMTERPPQSSSFPLFQKGSTSNESTSAVTKPSSPGNSTSTTSITIGAECGWDIAGPDTPLFGTACTWNCETTKSTSPPIPFRGSAQLRDDEDGSPASMVPAVLGSCKSEPVLDGDLLSWCSNPQLLEGASGSKGNEDDEELSRFFDSLCNTSEYSMPESAGSETKPGTNRPGTNRPATWQPLLHAQKPPTPSPKDGMFQVISANAPPPPSPPASAWDLGPSGKIGTPASTPSSLW